MYKGKNRQTMYMKKIGNKETQEGNNRVGKKVQYIRR